MLIPVGGLGNDHVEQDFVAPAKCLGKALFLEVDNANDEVAIQGEFAVPGLEARDYLVDHFHQEGTREAESSPVADGAADYPAEHVAPALVAGHHAIADEEGGGPGVLGDDPESEVGVGV